MFGLTNDRRKPIPPSEFQCWREITENIVYPVEYDIMIEMDKAFCDETNKELVSQEAKRQDEQRKELEKRGKKR